MTGHIQNQETAESNDSSTINNVWININKLNHEISEIKSILKEVKAFQEPILGIEKTAALLNISTQTLRNWVREGIIRAYKINHSKRSTYLFRIQTIEEDLENFL